MQKGIGCILVVIAIRVFVACSMRFLISAETVGSLKIRNVFAFSDEKQTRALLQRIA